MCFNSAKSWQFGWYAENRHHTVDADSNRAYLGKLVSILDDPNITGGDPMIIKIETGTNADYFINFNRKFGFNSGTVEGGNQVLVTVAGNGDSYVQSNLQAKLSAGQAWDATVGSNPNPKFHETVTVTVNTINTTGNGFAGIEICFGQCPNIDTPAPEAPVTSPTTRSSYCQDNDESFVFRGRSRTCEFINRRTGRRCSKDGAAENCPVTCTRDTRCTCYDTEGTFLTRGTQKDCDWAANRLIRRCNRNEVRSNCPLVCGVC